MPYVHLANGDVLTVSDKELAKYNADSAPGTIHKDGKQHHVIGIYPNEVELQVNEEEVAESQDRADYEEWRANKNNTNWNRDADTTSDERAF